MSDAQILVRDVSFSFGGKTVVDQLNFSINPGARIAIVGPNGVGKTTLLRLLAGHVTADSGVVEYRPSSATVGLLPQERDRRSGETLRSYLARRTGVDAAERELQHTTEQLAAGATEAEQRYTEALERYLALGGPDLESRQSAVCAELGLPEGMLDVPSVALSGGQLARAALASILLARFDILLLDEPTNDLDSDGLELLEAFLASRAEALVVVSHDRAFLEKLASHVLEIDEFTHQATLYAGGYGDYIRERHNARQRAREAYETYELKQAELTAEARQRREWSRTGALRDKHRMPDNDKTLRDRKIDRATRGASRASRAERALDRLEAVEAPRTAWELRLSLTTAGRSGDTVASLSNAVLHRGDFRLGPVNLHISHGDRIAITGPNGAGKSSLLQAILGRLPLTEGDRQLGSGVVIGEIGQTRESFDTAMPFLDAFRSATGLDATEARTLLAKFGLSTEHVLRSANSLSPGERTRADLALLMARGANLLVLDEPTNHLDLPAIEQLEMALDTYDGTLLVVTHDRRLLENLRVTRTITVGEGQVQ